MYTLFYLINRLEYYNVLAQKRIEINEIHTAAVESLLSLFKHTSNFYGNIEISCKT